MALFTSLSSALVEEGGKGNIALSKELVSNFFVKSGKVGKHTQLISPWFCIKGGRSCGMYSRMTYHPW